MTAPVQTAAKQARAAWIALAVVAALLAAIAAGLFYAGGITAADSRLLAAEGVAIEAEIVDRRIREERKRQGDGVWRTETTFLVTVSYTPRGGTLQRIEKAVTAERYERMPKGERVSLIYAPSKPAVFEFEAGDLASDAWWFRLVAVVLAVLGAGSGWGAWVLRRFARSLPPSLPPASERGQAR
jgi:hypothetical protein